MLYYSYTLGLGFRYCDRSTKRVSRAKTLVECSVFYENSKLKKKEKKEEQSQLIYNKYRLLARALTDRKLFCSLVTEVTVAVAGEAIPKCYVF